MTETDIFRALADPARRTILDRLLTAERNATELREGLNMSQPAVSQHIAVLREAGLVSATREGRHVLYRIRPEGLEPLVDWFARYQAFWPSRIDRLRTLLKEMDQ